MVQQTLSTFVNIVDIGILILCVIPPAFGNDGSLTYMRWRNYLPKSGQNRKEIQNSHISASTTGMVVYGWINTLLCPLAHVISIFYTRERASEEGERCR